VSSIALHHQKLLGKLTVGRSCLTDSQEEREWGWAEIWLQLKISYRGRRKDEGFGKIWSEAISEIKGLLGRCSFGNR
jgi:hypothetical protein